MKTFLILVLCTSIVIVTGQNSFPRACEAPHDNYPFCNRSLSISQRVSDLVGRLSIQQKATQLDNGAGAIEELGLPAYQWWSEALHGVNSNCDQATGRCPTSFPCGLNLGATFNMDLVANMAVAISDEARALRSANATTFLGSIMGLDVWAPNINIFRDPRWGRGQETPGEDPFLNGRYGATFAFNIEGRGEGPYLKLVATMKHFDAYSLENWHGVDRHHFDANVSAQDLNQTYYPAFKAAVESGNIHGVMCSYNSVNGVPSCANEFLAAKLRGEWGFDGYITSDCGAIGDIYQTHKYVPNATQATTVALKAGTDLDCGGVYGSSVVEAVQSGALPESVVDAALTHLYTIRMKLGMFDPLDGQPYSRIPIDVVDSYEHRQTALQLARESIVLLKNEAAEVPTGSAAPAPLLPLGSPGVTLKVALIGNNANATEQLCSNYHGGLPHIVSVLEALSNATDVAVQFSQGCDTACASDAGFAAAVSLAKSADVAVLVMGIDQSVESEGHDRTSITLPGMQSELIAQVLAAQPRTVLVLVNGGQLAIEKERDSVPAIIESFYPGEEGGTAIVDVLLGRYNPSGRLPYTIYPADYVQEISMFDMAMRQPPGRTYRFYTETPLWPFGFGLSYTTFAYSLELSGATSGQSRALQVTADQTVTVTVSVTNTGTRAGDVAVLAFISHTTTPGQDCPLKQLFAFEKIHELLPGHSATRSFAVTGEAAGCVNGVGDRVVVPGTYAVVVENAESRFDIVSQ